MPLCSLHEHRPLSVMCKILHGVAYKNIVIIKLCGLDGLFFYAGFREGDFTPNIIRQR